MNRPAASTSLLTLILALGLAAARPAAGQELDAYEAPAPAPLAPPAPPPPEAQRPEAWGRFGQPREVPPSAERPEARPDSGRSERDRHDDRRRRGGDEAHGSWGWDRYDRYDRYDPYRYDPYRYDGYRYDGYRADRYDRHRPPPRPPRYDPRWYPPVWTPSYRYRGGPWVPPPGFAPRRWSHGEVLPWTWWTPRHRIESWWSYGLPVPPLGFSWVRLGRDAVLVDLWTGRIVQVAYTLFW
ncbi:MAG: RcnB family protein [Phenylobacterium sp.]|uniref:RcnB family protein n=1 Tax=Phenylobacterium sp. TaxID=1871053 RepID=UPI0025F82DC1|nr:RcnB family protein [Phenylobacterium sp.]MCA6258614.1 RcnB family protein [Phenylobacterium sp.]